jgi:hypothetical protein
VKLVALSDPVVDFEGYRLPKAVDVSVHDDENGCPLVESTRTGKGFRGHIDVPVAASRTVAVPAGRRLTFTSVWPVGTPPTILSTMLPAAVSPDFCTSVVSFVSEPGHTYVIRFPAAANAGKRACGATAEVEGAPRNDHGPTELIAYPHVLRGSGAFQPGGLCALGAD